MTTTPLDALIKIRSQIVVVERHHADDPEAVTPVEMLKFLREREKFLMDEMERGEKWILI